MTIAFNALHEAHLGYAAIFLCVGFGFIFLSRIYKGEMGPGFWALGFFSNALGFLLWSGVIPLKPMLFYLLGEIFHQLGFFLLVYGALRFSRFRLPKGLTALFLISWIGVWLLSVLLVTKATAFSAVSLKLLRALLFLISGIILLIKKDETEPVGKKIAGASLLLWSSYIVLSLFIKMNGNIFFGLLIGFQVLAAFGMVAMVIDRIRVVSEEQERRVKKLEGILPICSYCKKIRDERQHWRILEEYIEDRSKAEFSHSICPECFAKFRPDR